MKEVCMIQVNAVLERLTTKEVLEYYGVHFNSRGFAHCPFHEDKTPSFYYYKKNDTFYCFSCHKGGNLINFVAEYFHYQLPGDLPKVLQQIDKDFHLGLDQELTPEEKRTYKEEHRLNKVIQKAEKSWEKELSDNYHKWATVYGNLYRQYIGSDEKDPEMETLLVQLEAALDDFSGNSLRAWPIQTLSEQQRKILQKELDRNNVIDFPSTRTRHQQKSATHVR